MVSDQKPFSEGDLVTISGGSGWKGKYRVKHCIKVGDGCWNVCLILSPSYTDWFNAWRLTKVS